MLRLFIHGLESDNQGAKGRYFSEHFPDMVAPNFSGDLDCRLAALAKAVVGHDDLLLVGSSFGGLMATLFTLAHPGRVRRLVLLAPAFNYVDPFTWEGRHCPVPARIYVGTEDTVTPADLLEPVARFLFTDLRFERLADDHKLLNTFRDLPWPQLLA